MIRQIEWDKDRIQRSALYIIPAAGRNEKGYCDICYRSMIMVMDKDFKGNAYIISFRRKSR